MTQYGDWAFEIPEDLQRAMRRCRTLEFLAEATAISSAFHRTMKAYDAGASRVRFREALSLATKEVSQRLLAPLMSLERTDPLWDDHYAFNRDHLPCLRWSGSSDRQIVTGVALTVCQILRAQGAQP